MSWSSGSVFKNLVWTYYVLLSTTFKPLVLHIHEKIFRVYFDQISELHSTANSYLMLQVQFFNKNSEKNLNHCGPLCVSGV